MKWCPQALSGDTPAGLVTPGDGKISAAAGQSAAAGTIGVLGSGGIGTVELNPATAGFP
jgi:succinyl-CoA synthetase alpha subunit